MPTSAEFLTPQELARALKISTYTAYELIKKGEIGAARVGRQLRIPRKELDRYFAEAARPVVEADSGEGAQRECEDRPKYEETLRIAGSHDPAMELLVSHTLRESPGLRIVMSYIGSMQGLIALFQRQATVATVHLWDDESERTSWLGHFLPNHKLTVVRLCLRTMGLGVAAGNPLGVGSLGDLRRREVRFVNRQRGSGTRVRLDRLLAAAEVDPTEILGYEDELNTHHAIAMALSTREADVGLVGETAARAAGLDFLPLYEEPYELVFESSSASLIAVDALLETIKSAGFQERLRRLPGYDTTTSGTHCKLST